MRSNANSRSRLASRSASMPRAEHAHAKSSSIVSVTPCPPRRGLRARRARWRGRPRCRPSRRPSAPSASRGDLGGRHAAARAALRSGRAACRPRPMSDAERAACRPPPPPACRPSSAAPPAGAASAGSRRPIPDRPWSSYLPFNGLLAMIALRSSARHRADPRRRRPDHRAFDHRRRAVAFEERHQRLALAELGDDLRGIELRDSGGTFRPPPAPPSGRAA